MYFKTKLVSCFGEKRETVEREEEGEEKRKRKEEDSSQDQASQGMELLTLSRDPWFCLVNGYCCTQT